MPFIRRHSVLRRCLPLSICLNKLTQLNPTNRWEELTLSLKGLLKNKWISFSYILQKGPKRKEQQKRSIKITKCRHCSRNPSTFYEETKNTHGSNNTHCSWLSVLPSLIYSTVQKWETILLHIKYVCIQCIVYFSTSQ